MCSEAANRNDISSWKLSGARRPRHRRSAESPKRSAAQSGKNHARGLVCACSLFDHRIQRYRKNKIGSVQLPHSHKKSLSGNGRAVHGRNNGPSHVVRYAKGIVYVLVRKAEVVNRRPREIDHRLRVEEPQNAISLHGPWCRSIAKTAKRTRAKHPVRFLKTRVRQPVREHLIQLSLREDERGRVEAAFLINQDRSRDQLRNSHESDEQDHSRDEHFDQRKAPRPPDLAAWPACELLHYVSALHLN